MNRQKGSVEIIPPVSSIMVTNNYVEVFENPHLYQSFINLNRKITIVSVISSKGNIILTYTKREREYIGY